MSQKQKATYQHTTTSDTRTANDKRCDTLARKKLAQEEELRRMEDEVRGMFLGFQNETIRLKLYLVPRRTKLRALEEASRYLTLHFTNPTLMISFQNGLALHRKAHIDDINHLLPRTAERRPEVR